MEFLNLTPFSKP